jgi:D-glycerate 3-kinase
MTDWIDAFLHAERLSAAYRGIIERQHVPLADQIATAAHGPAPLIVGLCGPQGSGKSTLAGSLQRLLGERALSSAILSLDDLYLTRSQRQALGRKVHPLLATRGVPGTHDIERGLATLRNLAQAGPTSMPSFDKACDDMRPSDEWPSIEGPLDIVLFEGWCVGARPQPDAELELPVNALERDEDPRGIWRRYVNAALASDYQELFARLDLLILLQAPDFESVYSWRLEQEHKLRDRLAMEAGSSLRAMSDAELLRFVSLFERLTRHILAEMPARADVLMPVIRA